MKKVLPVKILVPVAIAGGSRETRASDDRAVALACALRNEIGAGEVVAAGIGAAGEEDVLSALARGADHAIVIGSERATDPRAISHQLAALAKRGKADLIVLGDVPIEDSASQIAPRLAAILSWPCAMGAFALDTAPDRKTIVIHREIDRICEELELATPAVVGVSAIIATAPLLSLYEIVAARSKPIKRVKAASLGAVPPAGYTVLSTDRATVERKRRMIASIDDLITTLKEEAHVL